MYMGLHLLPVSLVSDKVLNGVNYFWKTRHKLFGTDFLYFGRGALCINEFRFIFVNSQVWLWFLCLGLASLLLIII